MHGKYTHCTYPMFYFLIFKLSIYICFCLWQVSAPFFRSLSFLQSLSAVVKFLMDLSWFYVTARQSFGGILNLAWWLNLSGWQTNSLAILFPLLFRQILFHLSSFCAPNLRGKSQLPEYHMSSFKPLCCTFCCCSTTFCFQKQEELYWILGHKQHLIPLPKM